MEVIGRPNVVAGAGLAAIAVYFAVLVHAAANWPYADWMLLILIPALISAGAIIVLRVTRDDADPMRTLILAALVAKLGAAFVRYIVTFDVYGGAADADRYHDVGTAIANNFHDHQMSIGELLAIGRGTQFMEGLTGIVYTAMGPSRLGGFIVYAWIGFWGQFLFTRALRTAVPEADHRRYALLVFFVPSLVFWPASIGKEAVMVLALGCCALGAARLCARARRWWLPLGVGIAICYFLRPHVGVVVLGALAVAVAFRRGRRDRPPVFGPAGRLALVAVIVIGMAFVFARAADDFLPATESTSVTGTAGELLDRAQSGTAIGGSVTESLTPTSPLDYPRAAFSVLFRPTLLEARNGANLVAAVETTFLLCLVVISRRRLRSVPTMMFRRPYVLFSLVYTAIFVFAWSSFANLGALARQRVQVWPFVLVLLVLPEWKAPGHRPAAPSPESRARPRTG